VGKKLIGEGGRPCRPGRGGRLRWGGQEEDCGEQRFYDDSSVVTDLGGGMLELSAACFAGGGGPRKKSHGRSEKGAKG